jgi:hypothetical protein
MAIRPGDRPHQHLAARTLHLLDGPDARNLAILDALFLLAIAIFQVMLAAGKPWGEYAWGGMKTGTLPGRLRWGSAFSVAMHVFWIAVVLIEGEVILDSLRSAVTGVLVWVLVGVLALATFMNGISRSKKERRMWTPVAGTALVLTALVAWLG